MIRRGRRTVVRGPQSRIVLALLALLAMLARTEEGSAATRVRRRSVDGQPSRFQPVFRRMRLRHTIREVWRK